MIVRTWTARARASNFDAYMGHFCGLVEPELRELPGFISGSVLQRPTEVDGEIHIVVMTTWDSFEAIHGFAGDDIAVAVVDPSAAAVLISYDRHVEHLYVAYEFPRQT